MHLYSCGNGVCVADDDDDNNKKSLWLGNLFQRPWTSLHFFPSTSINTHTQCSCGVFMHILMILTKLFSFLVLFFTIFLLLFCAANQRHWVLDVQHRHHRSGYFQYSHCELTKRARKNRKIASVPCFFFVPRNLRSEIKQTRPAWCICALFELYLSPWANKKNSNGKFIS